MWGLSHALSCHGPGSGPARGQLRPTGSGPPTGQAHGTVVRAGKGKLLPDQDGSELKAAQRPQGLCAACRFLATPALTCMGLPHATFQSLMGRAQRGAGPGWVGDRVRGAGGHKLQGGAGAAAAAPPHKLTPGRAPSVTSCGLLAAAVEQGKSAWLFLAVPE